MSISRWPTRVGQTIVSCRLSRRYPLPTVTGHERRCLSDRGMKMSFSGRPARVGQTIVFCRLSCRYPVPAVTGHQRRWSVPSNRQRGSALLAVLWLSAALAAIAFAMSTTVRGETQRTSTALDDLRSYYLASAGVEKAAMELLWSAPGGGAQSQLIPKGSFHVDYEFPSGRAHVEIIPEAAKLNVNKASPTDLFNLLTALGVDPERAGAITAAILDWRGAGSAGSPFDSYYSSLTPSFQSPHASFEEIEELLLVKGVTPEIFYGTWTPADADASSSPLVRHAGLNDCLTVYGLGSSVDVDAAEPAVLAAVGVSPGVIEAIMEHRLQYPFDEHMLGFVQSIGGNTRRLRAGGNSIITFRSTARLRLPNGELSDLRRTVGAQVKYLVPGSPGSEQSAYNVLRWYDTAWSN
jgi:general secretion pathway protein K